MVPKIQVNIAIARSLGSNKSNCAISELCYTGQNRSYNDLKLSWLPYFHISKTYYS